jgi:hypothetical protein
MKLRALVAVVIALSMPLSLSAQRVPKRVYVSAVDADGKPVTDLTAKEFQISESGQRRDVTRVTIGAPMRIMLLVDSSASTSSMMTNFRNALNGFVDLMPPEHEIGFVSSGGQIRVRAQPSADRDRLKAEIARFASEGGANAFLETLIETDQRFLKNTTGQWPVLVIATADLDTRQEPDVVRYNTFMNDFLARGGTAHTVLLAGRRIGAVSDIAKNLTENTGGMFLPIALDSALPDKLKSIAQRVVDDHHQMEERYEVEFSGDRGLQRPEISVGVTRDGVTVQMSPRRPF